jgi:ketosteroid isomerase-like protein
MPSDQELLTQAYQAFNNRDIDVALELMQPDVDWPNGMEGGRVHGHQSVRDYWTRQWQMIDPHVNPVRFTPTLDGKVVVDVRQVVRDLSGKVLSDQLIQHVYTIKDGLIERMEISEKF